MRLFTATAFSLVVVFAALGVQAQDAELSVIRGGVLNVKAVSLPKPDYPALLRGQEIGGTVKVAVEVDESGVVTTAIAESKVVRKFSDGRPDETVTIHEELRQAAEDAARRARFSPTTLSGKPVRVTGFIVYNFNPDVETRGGQPNAVSGYLLNGKATYLPMPAYPAAARAVRAEGTVSVEVTLDEAGQVIAANAVSGHPLLRRAAVEAARSARFSPTMLDNEPVKVTGVVVYNFVAGDDLDN